MTSHIFLDFSLAGLLLLAGYLLRVKINIFRRFLLPASILGGLLGLIAGPNGFGLVALTTEFSSYPGFLIALIYAALPFISVHINWKDLSQQASDLWGISVFAIVMQWAIGMLLTIFVLQFIWPSLHSGFSTILAAGFVGGHGTAAAIGSTYAALGWEDAQSLAMTSATVGIFASICGGIIWINLYKSTKAKNKPVHQFNESHHNSGNKNSLANEFADKNNDVIDPLAFQLCIVLTAFLGGYYLHSFWNTRIPEFKLPLFCLTFICALSLKQLLAACGLLSKINNAVIARIAGTLTDFLIVFGIAAIQLQIIRDYALPLTILFLAGILLSVVICALLGPVFIRQHWFEHALFTWGWITGIMAMGIALLRIVDRSNQTKALDHFALAYLFVVPIEVIMVTLAPQLISRQMEWVIIVVTVLIAALLLAYYGWRFIHKQHMS